MEEYPNPRHRRQPHKQSSCSFTILYVLIYTIRSSIIQCLSGLSFAKLSFVQIKYKYKMHHRWVCAKGRGDYLQQVHLRIFHSSKHCLASDKQKQEHRLVNNIGVDWLLQFARLKMEQCEGAVDHEVCESQILCLFIQLFLCHHLLASLAPDRPARLVVSPFPSPAARHSRSQVTLRVWTEENL